MVSLIAASHHSLTCHHHSIVRLNPIISSLVIAVNSRRHWRFQRQQKVCFSLFVGETGGCFVQGISELRRRSGCGGSGCCWCKGWESDGHGDEALEVEILEFMQESAKPQVFPTKRELVDAGRMDLAQAIVKKGGWLALGWDSSDDDDDDSQRQHKVLEVDIMRRYSDTSSLNTEELEGRGESCQEMEDGRSGPSSLPNDSSQSASSSGRFLEMEAGEDTGIAGILNRLEKQRNMSFGINLGKNIYSTRVSSENDGDDLHFGNSMNPDRADLGKNSRLISSDLNKGIFNNSCGELSHNGSVFQLDGVRNSFKPQTWRTWSIQRAGLSDTEFEAAEISFHKNQKELRKEASKDGILAITGGTTEAFDRNININHNQIRTRLQHLECELSSALHLLRSKSKESISKEGHEGFSDDLQKLSNAWEFQENDIMNAQDRLRSIRANLAILEGKMALAIIDAQKIVEEKQKRIDGARTALQVLRTTLIVWPNSASEVLLVGSFDGWITQRKMEKSNTGIFSVHLKLYPGRYEIKFIVDGAWRIDPLRPIVHNGGYENNLLIVT